MLFMRALLGLFCYEFLNAFCPFETMYRTVKQWKVANGARDRSTIDRVCTAVNHACIWYPKQTLCLQRSFVTTYLLRRHGFPAQMVVTNERCRQKIGRAHA